MSLPGEPSAPPAASALEPLEEGALNPTSVAPEPAGTEPIPAPTSKSPSSARDLLSRFFGRQPLPVVTPEGVPIERPTFFFFGVVAGLALLADVWTKAWAEVVLSKRLFLADPGITIVKKHLTLTLAYNKGGAWGLLQDASETIRRPFFFAVSVLAVLFIVSLYSKLVRGQHSLTWGLPFVLGGALGNLSDRVTRNSVIDFIDYRAEWVLSMNRAIARAVPQWGLTDHWPTFNIADVAICIGVGLMAVDMFTSRRGPERKEPPLTPVGASQPPVG